MTQYRGALKWALYLLALLAVGPLAAAPLAALRDATGGHAATILVNTSLVAGLTAALVLLLATTAVGMLTSYLVGPRQGLVAAGLVLFWGAWQTASQNDLIRATRDAAPIISLAIEGGALGAIGIIIGAIVWAVGAPRHTSTDTPADQRDARTLRSALALFRLPANQSVGTGGIAGGMIAALVAAALIVWLIAQEPLKGQCIAAVVAAGIGAAGFGRAVSSKSGDKNPIPPMICMALLALVGPLTAMFVTGGGSAFVLAALQGKAFALSMPMPLDWITGAFWGIPIGLSWADSMADKQDAKAA